MITLFTDDKITFDTPEAQERDGLATCRKCEKIKPSFLACDCLLYAFWEAGEYEAALCPEPSVIEGDPETPVIVSGPLSDTERVHQMMAGINDSCRAVWATCLGSAIEKISRFMLNKFYDVPAHEAYFYIKAPEDRAPVKYRAYSKVNVRYDADMVPWDDCPKLPMFPDSWAANGQVESSADDIQVWPESDEDLIRF